MEQLENVFSNTTKVPQAENLLTDSKYDLLSDIQLWNAFTEGDEDAFIKIYNVYFGQLCDFGIQYASIAIVEDAVQDLFIDLRKKRDNLPRLKRSIRSFLFQCLKRRMFNILKKQKKTQYRTLAENAFEIIPHHESVIILNQEHKEKLEKLDLALKSLNEKHREAIYYYFYKGMDYEEVRELLGYKEVKSARNLIYKVIKALRKNFVFFF